MIEGSVVIRWANDNAVMEPRKYWITFSRYDGKFSNGGQPRMEIVGQDSLIHYLERMQAATMSLEERTQAARQWLLEIHGTGRISLTNSWFTEEQYKPFQPPS
jgi:hypothetical protein